VSSNVSIATRSTVAPASVWPFANAWLTAMAEEIWIESEFGKGTTVLFTVPQHPVGIPVEAVESSTG